MPAIVMGQLSEKNVCPRNASPEFLTFFETFCEIDPNSNGTFFSQVMFFSIADII